MQAAKTNHLTKLTVKISFEQLAFWPQISLAVKRKKTSQLNKLLNGLLLDN